MVFSIEDLIRNWKAEDKAGAHNDLAIAFRGFLILLSFRDYNIITFLISTFILLEVEREEDIENKAVLEIPLRLDLKEKAHEEYSNLFNG